MPGQDKSYTESGALADSQSAPSFLQWRFAGAAGDFFDLSPKEEAAMNTETSESITSLTGPGVSTGLNGSNATNTVHRVAQKAHDAVDKLEQTVSSGSERVMSMQEEYGAYARDQIKANPIAMVAGAFAIGLLLGKVLR